MYEFGGGEGVKNFLTYPKFRSPTIIIFLVFCPEGKNSPGCLKKKYGNISCYFCSSFAIFSEFNCKFGNKNLPHFFFHSCTVYIHHYNPKSLLLRCYEMKDSSII